MRYNGYIIEKNYNHYDIYQGDDFVASADTIREAKETCDEIDEELYGNVL